MLVKIIGLALGWLCTRGGYGIQTVTIATYEPIACTCDVQKKVVLQNLRSSLHLQLYWYVVASCKNKRNRVVYTCNEHNRVPQLTCKNKSTVLR
jgi:hypothetical protein